MAVVVAAFPGTGKTFLTNNSQMKIHDSDSSSFSWLEPGVRNPDFPANYIEHIKSIQDEYDVIFVSTHSSVRDALVLNAIPHGLAFPERSMKDVYLERYAQRGSDAKFITMVDSKWDDFLTELEEYPHPFKMVIYGDNYLTETLVLQVKTSLEFDEFTRTNLVTYLENKVLVHSHEVAQAQAQLDIIRPSSK